MKKNLTSFVRLRTIFLFAFLISFTSLVGQIVKHESSFNPKPRAVTTNSPIQANNQVYTGVDQKLKSLVRAGQLEQTDIAYIITAQHKSSISQIHHIYYRQAINGLEVYGTESSSHFNSSGSELVSHNNFVKGLNESLRSASASLTAQEALEKVAQQMGYSLAGLAVLERSNQLNQKIIFNTADISERNIPAKLTFYYQKGQGTQLVWELSIKETDSANWWNFRVNATTGQIIDKDNWTVSCNILGDHSQHNHTSEIFKNENSLKDENLFYTASEEESMLVGSYRVYALPVESPNHGSRSLVTNPEDVTASPFGWHDLDGVAGSETTETRGNNVDAYEDGDNSGYSPSNGSLNFDFSFSGGQTFPSYSSTNQSEDAAITNLFYWSNIIHDVTYRYGFDEASGNFQENNYGNGGAGGDSVNAEAQDGSGTCNANFGTPADGGNPTMQMYTCNTRDGDFDNGVIIHEYGHGISNRLTGGPAAAGCLNNQEQMGEGWSDYYALVMTIESGDAGTDPRGMGTWLVGENENGPGIRSQRYDTDDNTYTYDSIKVEVAPHGVGSVWAMMLWQMTWDLIDIYGLDTDIYNGSGGNNIALALVTEGMKLQPCSPGFVDGRDAILAADLALYGGANQCTIWTAFAGRGLGYSADQGSTGSKGDGTQAFDVPPITLAVSSNSFCAAESPVTITGGVIAGGSYSGPGVTDDANGTTFTFDPAAAGVGTHTITYTATDCDGNVDTDTDTITVTNDPPTLTCSSVTLALDPLTGLATFDPTRPSSAVLVGSDNSTGSAGYSALVVNVTEDVTVSFDWLFDTTDDPQYDSFGYILDGTYFALSATTGDPQNSNFSIALTNGQEFGFCTFTSDNGFGEATSTVTNFAPGYMGQFQASNWTEVQQNSDGTADFFGASSEITSFCGVANVVASQTTFSCLDIGTTNVDVTVTDSSGQSATCTTAVTITGGSTATTYSGGTWTNGTPTGISTVTISDNYDTGVEGSFDSCSCQIDNSRTVNVRAGDYMRVSGDITVNGSLIVEHEGSVVQVDKDALVTNNGTINVEITTPILQTRDFMIMGSPMTAEERTGVFTDAFLVLKFNPTNFIPNVGVPAGGTNFADDDGNFYTTYNGTIHPGEGYVVRPQSGYTDPANTSYDMIYELGTLNNGNISHTFYNNGSLTNPNGTPNVLSNPYASAISANTFMSANGVSELYFWEHLTPPSTSLPGAGTMNFSMDDISYYNGSMGIPAANDPGTSTAPNGVISTGQGFAVRTSGASGTTGTMTFTNDMRLTTGNNTLRGAVDLDTEIEKLTLNVRNAQYGIGSYAGIAFQGAGSIELDEHLDTNRLATVVSLYTHLEDGSQQLGIQTRESFDSSIKISMGFATQVDAGLEYSISKSNFEGSNLSEATVYLIDHYTGTTTNLNETDYVFESHKGVFDGRFTVQFEGAILSTNDTVLEAVAVFPNPTNNELHIVSPRAIIERVTIHDVRGRKIREQGYSNSSRIQLDLSSLDSAMYFVTISTSKGSITKRVVKK